MCVSIFARRVAMILCLPLIIRLSVSAQVANFPEREIKIVLPQYLMSNRTSGQYPVSGMPYGSVGFGIEPMVPSPGGISASQEKFFREHIHVLARSRTIGATDTLPQILEASGVEPSPDATSLVYDLNPTLLTPTSVSRGSTLVVPTVLTDLERQEEGFQPSRIPVKLILDSTLKGELQKQAEEVQPSDLKHLVQRKDQNKARGHLQTISASLRLFAGGALPASRAMLEHVKAEAKKIISVLDTARSSRKKIQSTDVDHFQEIDSDLGEKVRELRSGRGDILVTVRTLDLDHREISGFLACFSDTPYDNTENCIQSFPSQSSPTASSLPVAAYRFWAAEPATGKRKSMARSIDVRRPDSGTFPVVDLTITP